MMKAPFKFKIGDYVRIIEYGHNYDAYWEAFRKMGGSKEFAGPSARWRSYGQVGVVKGRMVHLADGALNIYLVDLGSIEAVIGEGGLKSISRIKATLMYDL